LIEKRCFTIGNKKNNYVLCYKDLCKKFSRRPLEEIVQKSGAKYNAEKNMFILKYFNREYLISYPEGSITLKDFNHNDLSYESDTIMDKILIMSYLCRCTKSGLTNKWVPYREIEGVGCTYDFFAGHGIDKLTKYFGNRDELFLKAGKKLDAKKLCLGDMSLQFNIFPNVPVVLVLWLADEEFEAQANIFFDSSASKEIHIEDLASLCSKAADELIRCAKQVENF
jgi:hypothetical protein